MCGIFGVVRNNRKPIDKDRVIKATRLLQHRGPDDEGYYIDESVGLGMRRLSIIDLDRGGQPIWNEDKNLCIIYNGELYNFKELRNELLGRGHCFSTESDTEVIIHLYEEFGVNCLEKMNGMFSFAIWNVQTKELFVARDRLGIKPLYYTFYDNTFLFSSELKSIVFFLEELLLLNFYALDAYLEYLYVPSPETIYSGIKKLLPGHYITVKEDTLFLKKYWDLPQKAEVLDNKKDCFSQIHILLRDAIKKRLVSDVPFGAFLSGGLDSSIIVALMAHEMNMPVKTFSIGFDDESYDELAFSTLIAKKYQTDHISCPITAPSLMNVIHILINHFDEPFADSSALPTYYVSQIAASQVKMVLSGDGADELFGGYDRYRAFELSIKYQKIFHLMGIKSIAKFVGNLSENTDSHGFNKRLKRFLTGLQLSEEERYLSWMSCMNEYYKNVLYTESFGEIVGNEKARKKTEGFFSKEVFIDTTSVMKRDIKTYLPDDLLTKIDRMSMAHSLEVRVPFLDHNIVEFSQTIPFHLKIKKTYQKYILRKAFADLLPKTIYKRKKHGFGVPLGRWFKSELKEVVIEHLINQSVLVMRKILKPNGVEQVLAEHFSGKIDHGQRIYALLVLELWMRKYVS
ncbi:asparagine synthase (glutamine-hydrolyzing) [Chlamydiota bacterium]